MEREERALQLWSLLALCARNRQTLTYELVSRLTGLSADEVELNLEPLHLYCLQEHLPALVSLVVNEEDGRPRGEFLSTEEVLPERERVFQQDWLSWPVPSVEEIAAAVEGMSSDRTAKVVGSAEGKFTEV